tara:strand:+ start:759 stop:1361 length:603 start_codon:yes stop_codon:yes gene_type:complete
MTEKRKAYAPFSLITESGVANAPVEGYIDVDQMVRPIVNTGTVNEDGTWVGVKSTDDQFIEFTKHLAVANGAETLNPANAVNNHIDMTGFNQLFIAIHTTNAGNYAISAIMGPDSNRFANLSPVNSGALLKGSNPSATGNAMSDLFNDTAESLTADVWNIFIIGGNSTTGELGNQKNLQFAITNNSGGSADIETAFLRIV